MNLTYTRDIPATPNNPSNDQPPMRINNNSIDSILLLDHFGFNDNLGGYHDIIHQPNQATDPVNITVPVPINQIYPKSYTPDTTGGVADTELFTRTSLGDISQLTGYLKGAANEADGWQWLGGILIQWGTVLFTGSGQQQHTVTFKDRVTGAIPFPNFLYVVNTTLHPSGGSSTGNTQNVSVFTLNKLSFIWNYTGSSAYDKFYWIAIGS